MSKAIRPPDDVYWRFRRMPVCRQVGAECSSREDGYLYRVRADRVICRVVEGEMVETIDSIPFKLPAGAHVLTGANWGFRMPIGVFYQQIIGKSGENSEPNRWNVDCDE